jgi:hypothetical protein
VSAAQQRHVSARGLASRIALPQRAAMLWMRTRRLEVVRSHVGRPVHRGCVDHRDLAEGTAHTADGAWVVTVRG